MPGVVVVPMLDHYSGPDLKRLGSPAGGNVARKEERSPADTRKPEVGGVQPLNMIRQNRNAAEDMDEDSNGVLDEDVLDDWFIESLKMWACLCVHRWFWHPASGCPAVPQFSIA